MREETSLKLRDKNDCREARAEDGNAEKEGSRQALFKETFNPF